MTLVILYSILNFTLAGIPTGLVYIGIWSNISTGALLPWSVESDFSGVEDGVYRSLPEYVRQASNPIDDFQIPYRQLEVFCIAAFTFEYLLRLCTCSAGPGFCRFIRSFSSIVDLVSLASGFKSGEQWGVSTSVCVCS